MIQNIRSSLKGPKKIRGASTSTNLSVQPATPKAQHSSEMKCKRHLMTRMEVVICGRFELEGSENQQIWKMPLYIRYTMNNSSRQTRPEITIREDVMGVKSTYLLQVEKVAELACLTQSSKLHRVEEYSIAVLGDPKIITFSWQCLGKREEFHRPKITLKVRQLQCQEQAKLSLLIEMLRKRGQFQEQLNRTRENIQRCPKQQTFRQENGEKVIW